MNNRFYYRLFLKPILFGLAVVLLAGIYSYRKMQTSLFPDVIFPKITIIADNGDQPVDKMMITVTQPLEIAIKRVEGIQTVRSSTNRGSCTIEAFFDWNTDISMAKVQLESRIHEIKNSLPPATEIVVEAMSQNIYPVMGYTLESDNHGQVELKNEALFMIRPRFSEIQGISNVLVRGGRTKEFIIKPDPVKMVSLGLIPKQLTEVLANTNFIESNGLLSDYRRLYLTLTDTRMFGVDEIRKLIIRSDGKRILRLSDIAEVSVQEQREFIRINANGHDAVIIGLLLAIVVVIIFLHSFRASMEIILIIPVILALTFIVLHLTGITLNIMSLGAIAASIGLIIDDAIVIIEQLHRIHEENPGKTTNEVVRETIHGLLPAMIGSSLSTIVIFLPFVLMSGVASSFFRELTLTMEITLVCSFLVTWIGLPALHLLIGYKPSRRTLARLEAEKRGIHRQKLRWLIWFFNKPWFAIAFVILLAGSAAFLIPRLQTGFLPILDEGSIVLDYLAPPGTSLDASDAILREVDKIVISHPDVETYMRRTGTNMASSISMSTGVIPPYQGDYLIQLKPGIGKTTEQVIAELRKEVSATEPALNIEFGQRIADLLGDLIGRPQPVEVRIFGTDQATLKKLALQTQALLQGIIGVEDVQSGIIVDGPTITLKPDVAKLALFGLTPEDFKNQVTAFNEGIFVGEIQEQEQMLKIRMRFTDFRENSLEKIRKQIIFTPDGSGRPLSYFAETGISPGNPEITRDDLKSNIAVTARLDHRDLGGAIREIKQTLTEQLSLPAGYYIIYGGSYAEQQASFGEMLIILFAAILLVFTVLLFLFRYWRIPLLIIFISVLGIAGSVWLLFLTGIQLNVGSYTGIIMIVGIIAENAIFTVNQFMATYHATGDVDKSINYAISLRIRPKLMTAIGAILALTPLAMGIGLGAQMQQPLAIAVIGGFLAAMPLLLFVFPTLLRLAFTRWKS